MIHHHFDSIPSTHVWAKEHANEIQEPTLITADQQTGGIGQFGRGWVSPPGNLYASFCFRVPNGWKEIVHTAQFLSVSVAKVLIDQGFPVRLKWPNDLLIDGKKVGGVLSETMIDQTTLVIDSLGLNVNMQEFDAIDQLATSLAVEKGAQIDLIALTSQLVRHVETDLSLFLSEGFTPFSADFQQLLLR